VDQALLCQLADRHPEWNIVLLGQQLVDVSALRKRPNVHLCGRKRHAELPAYCKAFDVGLIPYVVSERMQYVNPIKLREYLSAGLPVVSTAVPEVGRYAEHCTVAESYDDFEAAVVRALASDSPERRRARSEAMRSETWEHKVACVGEHVSRVQRDRQARPSTGRR
jgi:glycosyltransferase involved in cell wall biosynthesis